jgi:hypothetical protein
MTTWQRERNILRECYGIVFPDSFFRFKEFLEELSKAGLSLQDSPLEIRVGPVFDVFDEKLDIEKFNPLLESRYYRDPPEFFTLLNGNTDGLHWGYYIDDPSHPTFPVAAYYHSSAYEFTLEGDDLFQALGRYLEKVSESTREYLHSDPANKSNYEEQLRKLDRIGVVLKKFEAESPALPKPPYVREITAPTRSGLGIVTKKSLYKESPELAQLLSQERLSDRDIQQLIQLAKDSIDAGYFGTALRIGEELWIERNCFTEVYELLDRVYQKLDRPVLQRALQSARVFRARALLK